MTTRSMTNILRLPIMSVSHPPTDAPRNRPTSEATPSMPCQCASRFSSVPIFSIATPMIDRT